MSALIIRMRGLGSITIHIHVRTTMEYATHHSDHTLIYVFLCRTTRKPKARRLGGRGGGGGGGGGLGIHGLRCLAECVGDFSNFWSACLPTVINVDFLLAGENAATGSMIGRLSAWVLR